MEGRGEGGDDDMCVGGCNNDMTMGGSSMQHFSGGNWENAILDTKSMKDLNMMVELNVECNCDKGNENDALMVPPVQ